MEALRNAVMALIPNQIYSDRSDAANSQSIATNNITPLKEFTIFERLPAELRLMIWELAIQDNRSRVLEVEWSEKHRRAYVRTPVPSLLHVNQESREEALKSVELWEQNQYVGAESQLSIPNPLRAYIDYSSDVLYISSSFGLGGRFGLDAPPAPRDGFLCKLVTHPIAEEKLRKIAFSYDSSTKGGIHDTFYILGLLDGLKGLENIYLDLGIDQYRSERKQITRIHKHDWARKGCLLTIDKAKYTSNEFAIWRERALDGVKIRALMQGALAKWAKVYGSAFGAMGRDVKSWSAVKVEVVECLRGDDTREIDNMGLWLKKHESWKTSFVGRWF